MKTRTRIAVFGGGGIVGLLAVGYLAGFFDFFSQVKFYSVKLVPQGISGLLKVEKNNKCNKGPHQGCLLFEEDRLGLIRFYLPGSKKMIKKCPQANQVITKIELTTLGVGGSDEADKGVFTGPFPLANWLKDDAFPNVDLDTGIVYEAALADAGTQAWLINLNSHATSAGVFSFWYRVTATDCAIPANEWVTDPRGDNEGIN